MKVIVDTEKCTGHAQCHAVGPDVYVLDEDGYNTTPEVVVAASLEQQAKGGMQACPERAIRIVE
jgi:ferredoxin